MICEKCNGFGYIQVDDGFNGMPRAIQCECVLNKALKVQAEKAWSNLGLVPVKESSLLDGKDRQNLLISSDRDMLRVHLRTAFANTKNPSLFMKVVGDHTLMSAWLGGLHAQGLAVADPDFQRHLKVYSLEDLAESPHLLIVRLGTKMARNSAMPEVLVETIEMREHLNRATWLVEEPTKPLEEGHLSWSSTLQEMIQGWSRVRIETKVMRRSNATETGKVTSNIGSHKRIKL
jgi:hypothetical protein